MNLEPSSSPPPLPPVSAPAGNASAHTIRWIELGLLLAVAFGGALYQAFAVLLDASLLTSIVSSRWLLGLVHEMSALGLCAYILHKQGRSFRQLGLDARWFDPFYGFGVMILGTLAAAAVRYAVYYASFYVHIQPTPSGRIATQLFGSAPAAGLFLFATVNGFFEELIVRAYVITELRFLTGRTVLAVLCSAGFQGAYHLYQGWPAALAATAGFLAFSWVYVWSGRIMPIIVAHILWDLYVILYYVYWRSL